MKPYKATTGAVIVKCGCGLIMRQHKWADHWRSCKVGSGVTATPEDEATLKAYEKIQIEEIKKARGV